MTDRITHEQAEQALGEIEYVQSAMRARRTLLAYIAQQRAASQWEPIATAPRDGTYVQVHHPKWVLQAVRIGMCINDSTGDWVDDANNMITATHWRPLPPPPEGT